MKFHDLPYKITFILFMLWSGLVLEAASFNCNKASTIVENAICENSQISNLDELLSAHYTYITSLLNNKERDILLNEQREWLKTRNSCSSMSNFLECLEQAYLDRIKELEEYRQHKYKENENEKPKFKS